MLNQSSEKKMLENVEERRKAYGRRVRKARLARGWTLLQLAGMIGLGDGSKGTISNIEIGRRWPSGPLALAIKDKLGVSTPTERRYGSSYSEGERENIAYQYLGGTA